jgi:hypothetical protein
MPSQQGLGLDKEASAASNREEPAQPCEHWSIGWSQGWAHHLSAQYGNLVTEYDDLDGQVLLSAL